MSNIKLVSLLSEVIKKSNAQYALKKNSSAKEIDEHSARSIFNYHLAETLKYPTYQFWKSFQEWPKPVPIVVDSRIVNLYTEHPQILEVVSQIPFKDLEYDLYKISNKTEKVIDITSFSFDEIKNFSFK